VAIKGLMIIIVVYAVDGPSSAGLIQKLEHQTELALLPDI